MAFPQSAAEFMASQTERLRRAPARRIVFPEGDDPRVSEAAAQLRRHGVIEPLLVGPDVNPETSPFASRYAVLYHERRRAKGITRMEAEGAVRHRLTFAAMMVSAGDAEGFVGSAVHTTAETARAVLRSIDLKPGFRRLSSLHVMAVRDRSMGHQGLLGFADAAILAAPSAVELAEIAIGATATIRALFEAEPRIALLSFSTKGSAQHREVDKVVNALRYVRERAPELNVDGELQADAALVDSVGRAKAPGSTVAGRANVLIFPDLNSANIGYKLVERLGEGALLAVLLQGVAKPVSLIPRGCTVEDIVNTAVLTAVQAPGRRAASV